MAGRKMGKVCFLLLFLVGGDAMKIPSHITESDFEHEKPADFLYESIADIQPGYQWNDAGGYCGSWASQRAILNIGAWVSQQQVRDHTEACGGHDTEILSCNIDEAWTNLKIDYERFDFESAKVPQTDEYFKWLKQQLAAGRVVAWMIMWDGETFPIYNLTAPAGMYGHVEPVVGLLSNHPLSDETVYDDDVVAHFTDGGVDTVYRTISTLPCAWPGPGQPADCGNYSYGIGYPYGFGWAAKGFAPDVKSPSSRPAYLRIEPWKREPDTRKGEAPEALRGELTATSLTAGVAYDVYRWDDVGVAFTYQEQYKKTTFTASGDTFVYLDPRSFPSDGTTYYRVVQAAEPEQ